MHERLAPRGVLGAFEPELLVPRRRPLPGGGAPGGGGAAASRERGGEVGATCWSQWRRRQLSVDSDCAWLADGAPQWFELMSWRFLRQEPRDLHHPLSVAVGRAGSLRWESRDKLRAQGTKNTKTELGVALTKVGGPR